MVRSTFRISLHILDTIEYSLARPACFRGYLKRESKIEETTCRKKGRKRQRKDNEIWTKEEGKTT